MNVQEPLRLSSEDIAYLRKFYRSLSAAFEDTLTATQLRSEYSHLSVVKFGALGRVFARNSADLDYLELNSQLIAELTEDRRSWGRRLDSNMAGWERRLFLDSMDLKAEKALHADLDDLVGVIGKQSADLSTWLCYLNFLAPYDISGLVDLVLRADDMASLRITDLGTLMDLVLINWSVTASGLSSVHRVIEVGGGYGRLADGFLSVWPQLALQYILVDAIPSSLVAAREYLRLSHPEKSISIAFGNEYDHDADILLIGAWNETALRNLKPADVFINIESFQEMSSDYVEHWFVSADSWLRKGGVAYISNSRAYVNKSPWPVPPNWSTALYTRTPRSWTADHPTAVFEK